MTGDPGTGTVRTTIALVVGSGRVLGAVGHALAAAFGAPVEALPVELTEYLAPPP